VAQVDERQTDKGYEREAKLVDYQLGSEKTAKLVNQLGSEKAERVGRARQEVVGCT
jgi:hypothetical protein